MPKVQNFQGVAIDSLTEFESFSSPATQTTTSNGWVTKAGYPYTSQEKPAGRYIIDFTAEVSNNSNNSEVGVRIQWRQGTSGTWITLKSIQTEIPRGGTVFLFTAFEEITLNTDTVFQVQFQFGQTDSGGTGSISEANLKIGKSAEI